MSITNAKKYDESGFPSAASSTEDLDQYGVWVKAGPETVEDESSDLDELELSDLSDIDTEITSEEEDLLGTLEEKGGTAGEELSLEGLDDFSFPESADASEEEGFTVPGEFSESRHGETSGNSEAESLDIDFGLEEEKLEAGLQKVEEEGASVDFNDLEAVEMDMSEPAPSSPKSGGVAGDILTKIELELASIKEELAELKRELSILKPAGTAQEKSAVSAEEAVEDVGFFEEDEDETIALTGDELDNILNTADITEEKGESDIPPEDLEIELKQDEDIISLEEPEEEAAAAPAAAPEALPGTTPEELAIIEEYNRELDNFGAEEFHIDEEDALDTGAVTKLPGDDDALEELQVEEVPAGQEGMEFDLEAISEPEALEEITAPEAEIPAEAEELLEMPEIPEAEEAEPEEIAVFEEELEEVLPAMEDIASEEIEEIPVELEEETLVPDLDLAEEAVEVTPIPPVMEEEPPVSEPSPAASGTGIPENLKDEVKSVLKYMDQLLEALPEEKIQEFAHSEHFEVYRKLFEELGLE